MIPEEGAIFPSPPPRGGAKEEYRVTQTYQRMALQEELDAAVRRAEGALAERTRLLGDLERLRCAPLALWLALGWSIRGRVFLFFLVKNHPWEPPPGPSTNQGSKIKIQKFQKSLLSIVDHPTHINTYGICIGIEFNPPKK